ncbi:PH domain-containing protein [soil metagenome]
MTDAQGETVVANIRPHARALFWPSVVLVADVGATAFFAGTLRPAWLNWFVLGAGVLLAVLLFFVPLFRWLARSYTITTRRLVLRSGVLVRDRQELLHSRGSDVTVRRSGLQLLFGTGDVRINTGQESPVVLRDVPAPRLVQAALHDLMERNSQQLASARES